jgi:hypothetical protein
MIVRCPAPLVNACKISATVSLEHHTNGILAGSTCEFKASDRVQQHSSCSTVVFVVLKNSLFCSQITVFEPTNKPLDRRGSCRMRITPLKANILRERFQRVVICWPIGLGPNNVRVESTAKGGLKTSSNSLSEQTEGYFERNARHHVRSYLE